MDWKTYKDLTYRICNRTQRPWGYEVKVEVWKEKEHIRTFTVNFKNDKVSEEDITVRVAKRVADIEAELLVPTPEPDVQMTGLEVVGLLIEKGYLKEGDSLDDLGVKNG